jgi:glycosyltransferase involved in cell wall biosynthesis
MTNSETAIAGSPLIDVVMATYNGDRFLSQQLDSIFSQSWRNIRVLVSDDGSSDGTLQILSQYAKQFPGQLLFEQNQIRLGPIGNFAALMKTSSAAYVAFCDQDDIWRPDKLARCMAPMLHIEAAKGGSTPVLIYTDMKLTSSDGAIQSESHWKKAGVYPQGASFRNLLAQNLVTGCTMMANRALIDLAASMPVSRVVMHDYWLALIASAFGVLHPIQQQTVLYRQHDMNAVGAGGALSTRQRLRRLRKDPALENWLRKAGIQAEAFLEMFGSKLSQTDQSALRAMAGLFGRSWVKRNVDLVRHGVRRTGLLNNLQFLIRL